MYHKINIAINLLFVVVLSYLALNYAQIHDHNLTALQKVKFLNKAADDFINVGFIICILSWIWTNVFVVKTKQLFWLCIPFLFTVFVSWIMSWQDEDIFIFNKQNGLWKGGFSLSYFFGTAIIIFAAVLLVINYFFLKSKIKK